MRATSIAERLPKFCNYDEKCLNLSSYVYGNNTEKTIIKVALFKIIRNLEKFRIIEKKHLRL